MVIWKYVLEATTGPQDLELPQFGRAIHAQLQHGRPTIWVECDPDVPKVTRSFQVVATGERFENPLAHVGTIDDGTFWFHLFEVERGEPGELTEANATVIGQALDWEAAARHLKETADGYAELLNKPGVDVRFALGGLVELQSQYDSGVRTSELHARMMGAE